MCEPISIGIATFAIGAITTVASYQQQQQQAAFADQQAYNQIIASNRAAESQAAFNMSQSLFAMEQQNQRVTLSNRRTLNDWLLSSQQTNTANARIQQEYLMAQEQANYTNLQNQLAFQTQLNEAMASEQRAQTQKKFNQLTLNQDLEAAQIKKNNAAAQRAFQAEQLMASNIQAQGSILAKGRSGQSVGLGVLNEGAKYGRDMRMARRNYEGAVSEFYSEQTNAFLRKAQSDADAMASILPRPMKPGPVPGVSSPVLNQFAPKPVFANYMDSPGPIQGPQYSPMYTPAPRPGALGLVAGIGSSALSGVTTGYQMNNLINKP